MVDLSFRPDPEPTAEPQQKAPQTPPPWIAGCKSSMLTVLTFFFLLAMTFLSCAGFLITNAHLAQVSKKVDELQKDVNDLKPPKPDDKKGGPARD
ncbi:MAG TPA: hypothetical protein VMS17_31350 [Gemmataceae bacterium]|nr:hypothetical protein [Gemmataceae bacterium]